MSEFLFAIYYVLLVCLAVGKRWVEHIAANPSAFVQYLIPLAAAQGCAHYLLRRRRARTGFAVSILVPAVLLGVWLIFQGDDPGAAAAAAGAGAGHGYGFMTGPAVGAGHSYGFGGARVPGPGSGRDILSPVPGVAAIVFCAFVVLLLRLLWDLHPSRRKVRSEENGGGPPL